MAKHFYRGNGAVIEFSQEAAVQLHDGSWFSPFMQHSYVARVTWPNGGEVIVALWPGAASEREHKLVDDVYEAAEMLPSGTIAYLPAKGAMSV